MLKHLSGIYALTSKSKFELRTKILKHYSIYLSFINFKWNLLNLVIHHIIYDA